MGKAIMAITPEFLFEILGLQKFRVLRTQYNFEKNTIEIVVENEIFPETDLSEKPPYAKPYYTSKYDDEKCVGIYMTEISFRANNGQHHRIKEADIPPFEKAEGTR